MFPKRRILALEQDSGKGKAACCRQESAVLVRLRREINGGNIPFPLFLGPQKQPRFHSKPEPPGINALITARRKFRFWIEIIQKNGGERGIRTLGGSFDPHSLSRRAPSASSAISPRPTPAVRGPVRSGAKVMAFHMINGGGRGIRTPVTRTAKRFSRPPPSTTRTSLQPPKKI